MKPDDIPQSDWDASMAFKNRVDARPMSAQEFVARAMMAAREEEREACAQEVYSATDSMHDEGDIVLKEIIAEAIRNRRNRKEA